MPAPTAQQLAAIHAQGNVLVMAGAGAGKTSTLVARILDRVLAPNNPTPLDRILVVTFNEAAAAEMRHRLASTLEARLAAEPGNPWIAEQHALLPGARVSTLHAFCLRLVRDHFHELDLDPRFTVQDELQTRLQRTAVLRELFRPHFAGPAPRSIAIRAFLERHARDRTEAVLRLVENVHDYARSLPEPSAWLAAQRTRFSDPAGLAWRESGPPGIRAWARTWQEHVEQCLSDDPENLAAVACLAALADLGTSDSPTSRPSPDAFLAPRPPLVRIAETADKTRWEKKKATAWIRPLKRLCEEARLLSSWFVPASEEEPDALAQDWEWARHDVLALLDLVEEFAFGFSESRRAVAAVDFADLEQLALRLLWDSSRQCPSDLARRQQARLEYVFVDEYQDINGAQDRILQCVSRDGSDANRFLVGDVKQSIYRFRRADPRIFQSYADLWKRGTNSTVLPLTENFRSHEAILDFVNSLFSRLLRKEAGGVVFDPADWLRLGAPESRDAYRSRPEERIEWHLYLTGVPDDSSETAPTTESDSGSGETPEGRDDSPDLDVEEAQARLAARRLRAMLESEYPVWDPSIRSHRPVRWRDMVVLHPAPRSASERWARAFATENVPLDARRGGFFSAIEVLDLVGLVRLLDNPRQDLPLLAVLRSPLVGMTLDELVALRVANRDVSCWDALQTLAASSAPTCEPPGSSGISHPLRPEEPESGAARDSARAKARSFLEAYDRWRRIAIRGSLAACLETVLADTGYEAWILGQTRAEARRANLRRLLAMTRKFDALQRHGLFRFIQHVEAQAELEDAVESAPSASGDSVRLLSMHQSKGLEFPVVVVAGLGRRFNDEELHGDWLLDPEFGICPPVVPPGHRRGYPSLTRWLAGERQRRDRIGEQLRLLYVACTRASEKLLLVGTARASTLEKWSVAKSPLPFRDLVQARSPIDWLGPMLPFVIGSPDVLTRDTGSAGSVTWQLWRSSAATPTQALPPASSNDDHPDAMPKPTTTDGTSSAADDPATLAARLGWLYPWTSAIVEPAKAAVTALGRQWRQDEETARSGIQGGLPPIRDETRTPTPSTRLEPRPSGDRQAAIERGLVHHLFNERIDLGRTRSRADLVSEAGRLVSEGWLEPAAAENLDLDGLEEFWNSTLADALRAEPDAVQRELPFTARLTTAEAARLGGIGVPSGFSDDDYQVVQGVVDLALVREKEIWIVDFKTDRVDPDRLQQEALGYFSQLRVYAHALGRIYGRPVTQAWLYFIGARAFASVPLEDSSGSKES